MKEYAVIFDTNSYRYLVNEKTEEQQKTSLAEIKTLEQKKNIIPYASVIVGMEMLANLTESDYGFNFKDCLNGVKTMATHCQEDDGETLRIFPHAALHITKSYFNFIPTELEDRVRNLGGVINDLKKDSKSAVKTHRERNTFDDIKQYIDGEEATFSSQITILIEGVRQEIINKHPKIAKKQLRAKLLDYIENGVFEPLMAFAVILAVSSKYQIQLPESEVINRAFSLNIEFPLSVGFFRWVAYKIVNDDIDMSSKTSREKRWNWVWDYHVSFALNESTLSGREIIIVTSDKDMTEMVGDFGYSNKVFTLTEYIEFLKE
ncbi:hypothetical protein [Flavobacterium lipolyticum]|uniref:PIN domain-containing protein n=1 Tax=Flavobacterium lipolyticum TaxID=2893754 RepID=A0ABS8M865_9FLAO|nr:hypothetical protein [Flavobacterium sp. F-126]MCC9020423.1 hypothetical protein [Flavobacterium sp. F-126]